MRALARAPPPPSRPFITQLDPWGGRHETRRVRFGEAFFDEDADVLYDVVDDHNTRRRSMILRSMILTRCIRSPTEGGVLHDGDPTGAIVDRVLRNRRS